MMCYKHQNTFCTQLRKIAELILLFNKLTTYRQISKMHFLTVFGLTLFRTGKLYITKSCKWITAL